MTGPRWSVRGMLQNTNAARDPQEVRTTNRAFRLGLLLGVIAAVWKFVTDDSETTSLLHWAAATGVLVFVTLFAFLIIDFLMGLYFKAKRRYTAKR